MSYDRNGAFMKKYFSAYAGLKKEVYILALARIVNCLGSFIYPLMTLILTRKLSMTSAEAGRLIALLTITQAPCLALGGKLADVIGRKFIFMTGCLLGAAFYFVCAFGVSGHAMIILLILAADMVALAIPAQDAMVADVTPENERQSAFSLIYLALNIGMAVSPILGGLLFLRHLQLLFFLDGTSTVACVLIVLFCIRETSPKKRAAERSEKEKEKEKEISFLQAMKEAPVLAVFLLLIFLFDFAYSQWSFLLPVQFGTDYGDNGASLYSFLCSANALTVIVLTPLITRLEKNIRPLIAIGMAGLMYTAAYIGFGLQGPYWLYVLLGELFTVAEIWSTIRTGPFIYHYAPEECRARIAAAEQFVRGAANASAPFFMGMLITDRGCRPGWLATAACVLAGAAGMFLLDRKIKHT